MPYHVLYARAPGDADVRASPGAFRLLIRTHKPGGRGKRQAFVLAEKRVSAKDGGVGIVTVSRSQMSDEAAGQYFYGAQAPKSQGGIHMSRHSASIEQHLSQENIAALKQAAVKSLEDKVKPQLSTSLDSGGLPSNIVAALKSAGYKTLEKAREAGEAILDVHGVGPKTLEKIQGVEAESVSEPTLEEPVKVPQHEPEPEPQQLEPIGMPNIPEEARERLDAMNIKTLYNKKTERARVTAGYFVLSPPEGLKTPSGEPVKKRTVKTYDTTGWEGWTVSGWNPKKFK